ncbi:MAG: hypothetical protein AB8U44_02445 [Aaplasma endosymbiont of Hyalomma asiaticum]
MPSLESMPNGQSERITRGGLWSGIASIAPKKINWKMVLLATFVAYIFGMVGMLLRAVALVGCVMVYGAAASMAVAYLVSSLKAYSRAYHMKKSAADLLMASVDSDEGYVDPAVLLVKIRDRVNDDVLVDVDCLPDAWSAGDISLLSKVSDSDSEDAFAVTMGTGAVISCSALLIVLGVFAAFITQSLLMGAIVTSLCALPMGLGVAGYVVTQLMMRLATSSLVTYDLALRNMESGKKARDVDAERSSDTASDTSATVADHIDTDASSGVAAYVVRDRQIGGAIRVSAVSLSESGETIDRTYLQSVFVGGPFVVEEDDLPSSKVDSESRAVALYTMQQLIA